MCESRFPHLEALGYEVVGERVKMPCRRCGGSGSYSYCQRYGTACFECTAVGRPPWSWRSAAAEEATAAKRAKARAARERAAARKAERARVELEAAKAALLTAHPGLSEALTCEHRISRDLALRFGQRGTLSPKQVELAFKLAADTKARAEEPKAAAPVGGRTEVCGMVISEKEVVSQYGVATKITVKVTTPAGYWLAWGTAPASLLRGLGEDDSLRGTTVRFHASLEAGRDQHFAFFKRPTKAEFVTC